MTLYFYLARRFLGAFLRAFVILTLLIYMLETLEKIRSLSKHGVEFGHAALLGLYSTPALVLQALPIIVMLGGLSFCVGLARSNEFVVVRAVGVAALRAMVPPALIAFLIGGMAVLFLNPLAAFFTIQHDHLKAAYTNSEKKAVSFGKDGFWLRQKDEAGHTVIHAGGTNIKGTSLLQATAFIFDDAGNLRMRIYARTAILRDNEWVFANGKLWQLGPNVPNPEETSQTFELRRFKTDITPDQILDGYPKPQSVPIWDKWRMIDTIASAGFSTLPHRIHLNIELSRPLMLLAMMIIGAAFTLQTARQGNLGVSVFLALTCGFSLYFLQNLAMTLGEAGEIPVFVAAWAPPLAAFLFAMGLFLRFEDG